MDKTETLHYTHIRVTDNKTGSETYNGWTNLYFEDNLTCYIIVDKIKVYVNKKHKIETNSQYIYLWQCEYAGRFELLQAISF